MPSPLGHALASAVIYKYRNPSPWMSDWKKLLFCLFAGISPDLDFIPGFMLGNKEMFHHRYSHTFTGAFLIAVCLWGLFGLGRRTWKRSDLFLFSMIVLIHPVMDVVCIDTSAPYGCPLLYPFKRDFWLSPFVFFQDIHRASLRDFLLGSNNLLAFWIEFIFFLPQLIVLTFFQLHPKRNWFWIGAWLTSLCVIMYYLHISVVTSDGIEFFRVIGGK